MSAVTPSLPDGLRLYVVGDIHGRLDLLTQLMTKIDEDRGSAPAATQMVFLGDYVDRGLYSRQVLDYLIARAAGENPSPIFLAGNHEQVMRTLLRDPHKHDLLDDWLHFGGRETLLSYGVMPSVLAGPRDKVMDLARAKVPPAHVDFLEKLQVSAVFGDYFFAHAGVRPGLDLAAQTEQDLLWIRYDFLNNTKPYGKIIVHGHTISPEVEFRPNRIGIDTGAYATGCLTALALEGTKRWLLQTG